MGRARRWRRALAGAACTVVVAGCGGGGGPAARPSAGPDLTRLPQATTFTTLRGLPQDPAPQAETDGTVVHPATPVEVAARPGGPAVAALPDRQLDGPTWVPVVAARAGWLQVLLPSRPNGVTGWVRDDGRLTVARTSHLVRVDLARRRLTLWESGRRTGAWTVAVGAARTPTPKGRTFLLALLKPARPTFSPLIVPVGTHSETLETFGGGPGTVAFHGWRDASVFGKAVTHGCIRVPGDALTRLSRIPLGTLVLVT
ncbi:L,D-transpeptidase [Thermomonospora cellulosilytica]|uniref:Lipoprotein-anchoring transpeptidase ErfK/SrfK n=1 Tax=Thermomonospora cellulosilytica TaxID=1411118 RepID=A0A7W3R768_9ACTN|nr:L,D-transpeptidase [Thermomonospora cellulosilytica]MBA9002938.1 lipoprotein-anchoring transpeptidase ErfK/SrfK [Thermomonospora cellulosilytica]